MNIKYMGHLTFAAEVTNARHTMVRWAHVPPSATINSMKHLPIVLTACLVLQACGSDPSESPQYKQLEEDSKRTEAVVAQRDSAINDLFATMNRISENLRAIRAKQGQLTQPETGAETDADMEQRIMTDIADIDGMIAENKKLIDRLRKQAKTSAANIVELEATIAEMERGLAEKDTEIGTLKEQLASTNSSLATLIDMYRDKSQLADMQRGEMNTGWYAVGTTKELRASGVLSKTGGVVGIGSVDKLNAESLPNDQFTRVDVMKTLEIPLMAKKAKLATSHPAGSYKFEGVAEKLVITDPNAFWSVSKYLVIVVE